MHPKGDRQSPGVHVLPGPQWLAVPVHRARSEDFPSRRLHFKSPDKVVELVEQGGGIKDQESRMMLNHRPSPPAAVEYS
jgi:hypothetical protein